LKKPIPDFEIMGLHSYIFFRQNQRDLNRKLAIMRAILKKSKIITLKDAPWIIESIKLTDIIREVKINCTVIGIINDLAGCACLKIGLSR
jgi:hypothetical protein